MPDPARLTDEELAEMAAVHGRRETADGPVWRVPGWDDVSGLLARLAAAENVVEAARSYTTRGGSYYAVNEALAAYDAQKENHG